VFDMFGKNSAKAEALIQATKATLFQRHDDERKHENAERVGKFVSSLVQLHQRMYQSICTGESENEDVKDMSDYLFAPNSANGADDESALIDKPLLAALEMMSEITLDHPKRLLIALIKVCDHLNKTRRNGILSDEPISKLRGMLAEYVSDPAAGKDFQCLGEKKDANGNVVSQQWQVTLQTLKGEAIKITTVVDANITDADKHHKDEWAIGKDRDPHPCESTALVRAWSKLLCKLLKKVWKEAVKDDDGTPGGQHEGQAYVDYIQRGLSQRLDCARQIVHMLVLESGTDVIDEFNTAFEGLRVKRLVTAYYRSILCYLAWYMGMRKFKLPWLSKLMYQMPVEMRGTDQFVVLRKEGEIKAIEKCFVGQFGILQFCRRVAYTTFNCRSSGLQRTDLPLLVQKLFELQRAFDVDLTDGRMFDAPEAIRSSLAERVELTDCFAINVLHTVGPLRPLIGSIYLNRKLLTGTGLQSPVAFQEQYAHLADEQVSMYLRLVERVNPALTPHVDGQVAAAVRGRGNANDDAVSMSASLMEDFDGADGLSAVFGAGNRRGSGGNADTMSIGSKGSIGSARSTAGESSATAKKNHPVMAFIPVATKLFIALARAKQGIFTWNLYETIARTIVMESVLKVSECTLESPFSNLPLQQQLRKILESTMEMASAESTGGESRESALKLSGTMGRLLGLETHLVDGMLAVVDKSPQSRQHALGNLGAFLAKSITSSAAGGGGGGGGGSGAGGAGGGELVSNADGKGPKGDSSMQISATISGLVALASNDFEGARHMAVKLGGFDVAKIQRLFAFCSAMYKAGMRDEEVATRTARDPVAAVEGVLTDEKLYVAFDASGNANMDYNEFETCTKYMTFPSRLTTITAMRLYARADRDHMRGLSLVEYRIAMVEFADEVAEIVLAKRGLTLADNRKALTVDILTLVVIFVFIFVGIIAFTTVGGFESTVNSLLPIVAGLGITLGSSEEEVTDEDDSDLLDDIEEAMNELTETE